MEKQFNKNLQYYKFGMYGFLKNMKFFEPFFILFFIEKGLSYFQIGVLYSIKEVVVNLTEIPTGIIADAVGRKRTMVFSFLFYIISFCIFYFSQNYIYFVIAIIFFGLGNSFRSGTHKAMIFEYLKNNGWENQKVFYYGHTRAFSQLGSALSAIIAGFIVFYQGNYSHIFIYSVIPYFADLLLILSYPKNLNGNIKHIEYSQITQKFKIIIKELIYSLQNFEILKSIINLSVYEGFNKAIKDYLQKILELFALSLPILFYLDPKKKTAIVISAIYFCIYIFTAIASKNSGKIANKFKNFSLALNFTLILGIIFGVIAGVFYRLQVFWVSVAFFVLIYIVENIRKPIGISYISDKSNNDILATVLSVQSQAVTIFTAITALLMGYLADKYGIGNAILITSLIFIILFPLYRLKETNIDSV